MSMSVKKGSSVRKFLNPRKHEHAFEQATRRLSDLSSASACSKRASLMPLMAESRTMKMSGLCSQYVSDIRRRRQLLRGGQGENGGGRVRHDIFVLDDLSIMQLDRILEVNEGKEYYSPRVADLNQRCSVESANQ